MDTKIWLFNTRTRHKEPFIQNGDNPVGLYTCGPTVYSYPHIGNYRAYVFADILCRALKYNGFVVHQVMNITDVGHLTSDADEGEDKVELQAKKTGESVWEITEFFFKIFRTNLGLLNIEMPSIFCKATDHVQEQIALVQKLEDNGFTYQTSDGVYFDTSKFPRYGEMARLKISGLRPGARVKLSEEKRNPTDFALWKLSHEGEKRQMEWQSQWGVGFPGWHIECSAMAMKYLGETIDIHTGGIDHIPVHHTNEIAQSEAVTGKQFARYWVHCAFLVVDGQKMSKSLGNIFTIQDLVDKGYDPMMFRYLLLTAHYRSTINFTWKSIEAVSKAMNSLRSAIAEWPDGGEPDAVMLAEFRSRINDDLNTPRGIALLWEVVDGKLPTSVKKATLLDFDKVLGLRLAESTSDRVNVDEVPASVQHLLAEREQMRRSGDWGGSDRIRESIRTLGYLVEDTSNGVQIKQLPRK